MVFWIGGEAKYFRQNYLKLISFLPLFGSTNGDKQLPSDKKGLKNLVTSFIWW